MQVDRTVPQQGNQQGSDPGVAADEFPLGDRVAAMTTGEQHLVQVRDSQLAAGVLPRAIRSQPVEGDQLRIVVVKWVQPDLGP